MYEAIDGSRALIGLCATSALLLITAVAYIWTKRARPVRNALIIVSIGFLISAANFSRFL
jgi:hypothetical protein